MFLLTNVNVSGFCHLIYKLVCNNLILLHCLCNSSKLNINNLLYLKKKTDLVSVSVALSYFVSHKSLGGHHILVLDYPK